MGVSPYRAMWLCAMFDLPVDSPAARKEYTRFRKALLKDGFVMLQFSVYARFCESEDAAKVHRKLVKSSLPPDGDVRMIAFTDRQYEKMEIYIGKKKAQTERPMEQLTLF
jgi:CRISPR-associated protein Cas2